jgi:hypothetical protein
MNIPNTNILLLGWRTDEWPYAEEVELCKVGHCHVLLLLPLSNPMKRKKKDLIIYDQIHFSL